MDLSAVQSCFDTARDFFGAAGGAVGPPEIIIADEELICSMAISANVELLGFEEPKVAEDVVGR